MGRAMGSLNNVKGKQDKFKNAASYTTSSHRKVHDDAMAALGLGAHNDAKRERKMKREKEQKRKAKRNKRRSSLLFNKEKKEKGCTTTTCERRNGSDGRCRISQKTSSCSSHTRERTQRTRQRNVAERDASSCTNMH